MFRRSILQISSRRGLRKIPRSISSQHVSRFLRREFSAAASKIAPQQPGGAGGLPPPPPENGGSSAKIFLGSAVVGAGLVGAYKTGYLDPIFGAKEKSDLHKEAGIGVEEKLVEEEKHDEEKAGNVEEKIETHSDVAHVEGLSGRDGEEHSQVDDNKSESDITSEKALPEFSQNENLGLSSEGNVDVKSTEEKTSVEITEEVQTSPIVSQTNADQRQENEVKTLPHQQDITEDKVQVALGNNEEPSGSLLKTYNLSDEADESTATNSNNENDQVSKEKEALVDAIEGLNDAYISKDGKLVLDFLQTIHAAEKRQAELDARVFSEEKRTLKEKYEKKLKDAGARELMLAEKAAMLDKVKELSYYLLFINALCVAFYARSEEARQTHSAHKLALGALALEDALSKGLPIQTEIEALHTYLEGIDKDSILDLVLSSLPEETRRNGTDTLLQLNQKFDALKGTVRHLSLIPLGGGGILAHSLAHIASWLKVKEVDQSGDGIESIINKVESCLADGKIAEAAEALEEGVKGTQATEVVREWVKRARNRAITDQALTLLQSYATSISVT
ncbi:PREDICTED: uncharacterized protein LOC103343841 [Prunus mume]|uniref:Uncharacterized protein LOC103343841 n=1 Tax=Prunus mume TaxID=102107 RepID=A0ABM0PWL5_PRUMU|nr:PREDICTED: uncharacterized protein LOC103343841 [Prunus mume]